MPPPKRVDCWAKKRVFFLTPQVFQNDLGRGSCHADNIVCIVIDEAHKALGNHAYCQVGTAKVKFKLPLGNHHVIKICIIRSRINLFHNILIKVII